MSSYSKVRNRNDKFTSKIQTKITKETLCDYNPYLTDAIHIHGYNHIDLLNKYEFTDIVFLLFTGELPNSKQKNLLRKLFVALINPGPRHPAAQAGISSVVGKTVAVNVLPIVLSIYGGDFDAAGEVESAMHYYFHNSSRNIEEIINELSRQENFSIPGFGTLYGDPDPYAEILLTQFANGGEVIDWVIEMNEELKPLNIGISRTGLCAAILVELNFSAKLGNCLMQLMAAPGLLAHSMEFIDKPLTSMLFESDENYEIEYEK